MKITIFTHPNPRMDILESIIKNIKDNSKVSVEIEVTWKKIRDCENIEGIKVYALTDPFHTIDSCLNEYDLKATNKSYRHNIIKDKLGYILNEYSDIESSVLSYLLWVEISKKSGIECVFKVENPDNLYSYLKEKKILEKNIKFHQKTYARFKVKNINIYKNMSLGTLSLLVKYCKFYDYYNYLKDLK